MIAESRTETRNRPLSEALLRVDPRTHSRALKGPRPRALMAAMAALPVAAAATAALPVVVAAMAVLPAVVAATAAPPVVVAAMAAAHPAVVVVMAAVAAVPASAIATAVSGVVRRSRRTSIASTARSASRRSV